MPIIYIDRSVKNGEKDRHPSLVVDEMHPCHRMVREAIDGKSVFRFDRGQAYAMYEWYCEGWKSKDLYDEFGEKVSEYTFQDILKKSHYMIPDGKKMVPSLETIEDLHAAIEMERKILESNGDENS